MSEIPGLLIALLEVASTVDVAGTVAAVDTGLAGAGTGTGEEAVNTPPANILAPRGLPYFYSRLLITECERKIETTNVKAISQQLGKWFELYLVHF